MMFVAIGFLTYLTVVVLSLRRAVSERTIRWRLYALRDDLRELAYHHKELLTNRLFRRLDLSISSQCAVLPDVSLWSLLPVFLLDFEGRKSVDARQQQYAVELQRPENAEMSKLYEKSVNLMIRHLLWRHMFLTMLAAITFIGFLPAYFCARWASERIISGTIIPVPTPLGSRMVRAA